MPAFPVDVWKWAQFATQTPILCTPSCPQQNEYRESVLTVVHVYCNACTLKNFTFTIPMLTLFSNWRTRTRLNR
eukprot:745937-Rhodomonas_salina.1